MTEDTLRKRLEWKLDVDLDDVKKDLVVLGSDLKRAGSAVNDMAKDFSKAVGIMESEIKTLNHELKSSLAMGFGAVTKAITDLQTVMKPVSREVDALGKDVNSFLRGITREAEKADKAMRQFGMNRADKAADNYAASIAKASANVEVLKQKLASANLEEKKKIELQAKIIEGEKQIATLTQRSTEHITKARQAEEARARATADNLGKQRTAEARGAMNDLGMMSGAAGAVLTAGIASAAKEFGNFEAQMIKFNAVSNATADEMAAIEKQARDLGASTKYTAAEIGAAQVELAKMGFSAKETVAAMGAMVDAAIASGDPLEEVSATIAATIRMFNMSASDAGKVSDQITRGANISAQSFKSYSDSMRYVGAAANGLNQDLGTVATALNVLADRQIKGTQAGEHLKIALNRLATQPKPAAEAIKDLNLQIADTKGTLDKSDDTFRNFFDIIKQIKAEFAAKGYNSIEQTNFLKKLFGAEAVASMRIFTDASNETIDAAIAKQADFAGSTKETADKMKDGFNYAIEEMQGALNDLQITIGKDVAPVLTQLAKDVQYVIEAFKGIPEPVRQMLSEIGLLAAGVFTAFAGAAGINFVVGTGVNSFKTLAKAMLGDVMPAFGKMTPAINGAIGVGSKGLVGLDAALTAAGTVGLPAFGSAMALLVAGGAAIWVLLKAIKDMNDAFDQLDRSMQTYREARELTADGLSEAIKILESGGKLTDEQIRKAAGDGKLQIRETRQQVEGLRLLFREWVNLKEQLANSTGNDRTSNKGALTLQLKETEDELKAILKSDEITSDAIKGKMALLLRQSTNLETASAKFQALAAQAGQRQREEAAKPTPTPTPNPGAGDGGEDDTEKTFKDRIQLLDQKHERELRDIETGNLRAEREAQQAQQNVQNTQAQIRAMDGMNAKMEASSRLFAIYADSNKDCYLQFGKALREAEIAAGILSRNNKVLKQGQSIWADIRATERPSAYQFQGAADRAVQRGLLERYQPKSMSEVTPGTMVVFKSGTTSRSGHVATVGKDGLERSDYTGGMVAQSLAMGANGWAAQGKILFYRYRETATQTMNDVEKVAVTHQQDLLKIQGDGFQKRIRALMNQRSQWEALMKQIPAGETEAIESVKDKISAINKQIETERGKSADNAAKIAKIERDYYEKTLDGLVKLYENRVEAAQKLAEEGKKLFYSTPEDLSVDAVFKEMEGMEARYAEAQQTVDDLTVALSKAKAEMKTLGPAGAAEMERLKDLLAAAKNEAGRLAYQIQHLYGAGSPAATETRTLDGPVPVRVRINIPEVAGVAGKRASQMAEAGFDEANRKGQEFIKAIKGSEDAIKQLAIVSTLALDAAGNPIHNLTLNMDEFAKSTNLSEEALNGLGLRLGKMNFDDFLYKLQQALPADAFNQLINTIESNAVMDKWERDMKFKGEKYKAAVSAFTKALKEQLEKTANAARRAKELWEDNLSQFSQIASLAFNDVINILQNSGNEVGVILSDILNGTSEIGSGIARVFSGDIAGGAYQSITGFFNMFSRLMTRSIEQSKELIDIYSQLGKAVQDRQAVELQNQIEDARRKGLPTKGLEITQAQTNTQSAMERAVSEFWGAPLQSGKGILASMPKAANGKLDYEKIIGDAEAQYKRDSKGPRNLQDALSWAISGYNPLNYFLRVKALVENLKTLEAQGAGQVDEINARIDQASATLNENDQKLAQQGTLEANYTFAQSRKKSEAKNVEFLLDSYVGADPALREAMKSTAESLVSEQRAILDEVNAAFGHDPKKEAEEIAIRLGEFNKEIQNRLSKGVADFNKNASEKRDQEVDDEFKKRIEGLKKARTKLYEQETSEIRGLIKARQDDLAVIDEQNKALQRSIDLEEEKRRASLKQFDAQDLTLFAQKKAGVNYDTTIRQALDDIANPDGVLTDTFSSKSISEAIQAWVEQRSLENENAYGLEQYSSASSEQNQLAYLARIQEIAAFQSRAAEEALKKEGLTTKQRNELTAMAREGYKSFQEANRKQIDLTADTQIQRINDVIQSNNQLATSISDQISGYQKELDSFTSAHEASLKEIDNRVNDIIDSQDEWLASAESLKDGIAKPLQEIIDLYNKVKSAAQSVAKDLSAPSGKSTSTDPNITLIDKVKNTGQSRAEMSARGYQVQGSDYWYKNSTDMQNDMIGLQAAKMATGGVVPPGYPNDTFPALLSSGESVLPTWFTDMLKRSSNLLLGGGGGVYNNQRANIEIHIHDAQNPMQIKQTILNTLKDAGISTSGSSVNGAYFGNLGMN